MAWGGPFMMNTNGPEGPDMMAQEVRGDHLCQVDHSVTRDKPIMLESPSCGNQKGEICSLQEVILPDYELDL